MSQRLSDLRSSGRKLFLVTGRQAPYPTVQMKELEKGEAIGWWVNRDNDGFRFETIPSKTKHQRHRKNYVKGELSQKESFYFKGPEGKLNLRAYDAGGSKPSALENHH